MSDSASAVGRYYDRNTRRFLALGHGGPQKAIRRAVWAPSIDNRGDAINYVNRLALRELKLARPRFVLDLGCGVGGSISYLSREWEARYLGVTISRAQVAIGTRYLVDEGIANAGIVHGDFVSDDFRTTLDEPADFAIAIESLIHITDLPTHLASIARLVAPGGRLLICDDVLSSWVDPDESGARGRRWLREFRIGWHAAGLTSFRTLVRAAEEAGLDLVEARDLTPYLELDRGRDLGARALLALLRWSPVRPAWFANLLGGNALQLCLKNGLIRYVCMVFARR